MDGQGDSYIPPQTLFAGGIKILYMTIQWTFLPSLVQICFVVSEKKIIPIGSNVKLSQVMAAILDNYAIGTKITNLVEDHPVIIAIMLQFHRLSSFWQEDFQIFNQSEHIMFLPPIFMFAQVIE
jgi:hypothetical protein